MRKYARRMGRNLKVGIHQNFVSANKSSFHSKRTYLRSMHDAYDTDCLRNFQRKTKLYYGGYTKCQLYIGKIQKAFYVFLHYLAFLRW